MDEKTILGSSNIGKRLDGIVKHEPLSFITFNKKNIPLVGKITIGRDPVSTIVVNDMLASRNHALIQKIKDDFFIRDLESTNGTSVNNVTVPKDKYVKLSPGDIITVGKTHLCIQ